MKSICPFESSSFSKESTVGGVLPLPPSFTLREASTRDLASTAGCLGGADLALRASLRASFATFGDTADASPRLSAFSRAALMTKATCSSLSSFSSRSRGNLRVPDQNGWPVSSSMEVSGCSFTKALTSSMNRLCSSFAAQTDAARAVPAAFLFGWFSVWTVSSAVWNKSAVSVASPFSVSPNSRTRSTSVSVDLSSASASSMSLLRVAMASGKARKCSSKSSLAHWIVCSGL
mmetsp:Transcript_15383/g.45570  ORF Transcript_15383/g.45570 Transcript_15383/m.45570 type:complete len:233 (-) Transcript_15383:2075-2773(-)